MKKVILMICLAFVFSQTSNAQVDFGLKGGVNYNSNSIKESGQDVFDGAESKAGYHAGIWFSGELPIIGLYLRPEIVYTQVKSEYLYKSISTDYDFQKIDVPVLLGKKVFGFGNIFIGPSFQYILEDKFNFADLTTDDFDKFSVGVQMGFGIEFGNLGIDARWERGLSNTETTFVDNNTNINIDNRTNQIIFGLSFKL